MIVQERETSRSIPRASSPEEAGVSSAQLCAFLEDMERTGIENHSFMVIRHGKVASEGWVKPFTPERPHTMYSGSKSVTSTAIGFAVSEGLLSLDTKVTDLFPEHPPQKPDPRFEKLTVRTLLTMSSGKEPSLLADKSRIDWIDDFFNSRWTFTPGTSFRYTNENIFMLCAAIHRVTGQSVIDYLTPRLFEPLGIARPFWETDQNGVEAGGWGLYLTTEELAKLILCYQQGGMWAGKQVIPAEWAREAGRKQIDNSDSVELDCSHGYGYCFWRNGGCERSYRLDGMFSQFGIVFEEFDAVLVMTNGHMDEQEMRDCIWRHFPAAFERADAQADKASQAQAAKDLRDRLAARELPRLPASGHMPLEQRLEKSFIKVRRTILLNLAGFPVSVMPLPVTYMTTDKAGNIDNIRLTFRENECTMRWTEGDEENTVICGMNGHYRYGKIRLGGISYTVCCCAAWRADGALEIWIRPLETIAMRKLNFKFHGDRVVIKPSCTPAVRVMAENLAGGAVSDMIKNPIAAKIARLGLRLGWRVLEPRLHGKLRT